MPKNATIFFIINLTILSFFVGWPAGTVSAINDVLIPNNINFELNTFDTAALTTIVVSFGGQVTNFNIETNYIDITIDNLSTVTFTTTVGGQYLKIEKQSGSDNYTVNPSCLTNTATLAGLGATVVLRLKVLTTNSCYSQPGGGGGGNSFIPPVTGSCGIANNGALYYSAPTINLCSAGSPSAVSGSGPWTWICIGLYGGPNSPTCFANKAVSLPTGCISNLGYSTTTGLPCSGISAPVLPPATPATSTTSLTCAAYLTKSIKLGGANSSTEVKKLQAFLKNYEGFTSLAQTGVYGQTTYNAVKIFQQRYFKDILAPGGLAAPTGYVYTATIKKINEIYCKGKPTSKPVTPVVPLKPTAPATSTKSLTPAQTACAPYMTKYIKLGAANNVGEVKKLQIFLKDYEGFTSLAQTGVYDQATYNAVKIFQQRYSKDILVPGGFIVPTGYVYSATIKKINEIYCRQVSLQFHQLKGF